MNTSREHQTSVSATLTRLLEISKIKSSFPAEKKKMQTCLRQKSDSRRYLGHIALWLLKCMHFIIECNLCMIIFLYFNVYEYCMI